MIAILKGGNAIDLRLYPDGGSCVVMERPWPMSRETEDIQGSSQICERMMGGGGGLFKLTINLGVFRADGLTHVALSGLSRT